MRDRTPNSLSFIMAWYVAYPISYRQLEEMMGERGVRVDHATLNRWVIKYAPEIEKRYRRRQCPVG
jgi:putative transposase